MAPDHAKALYRRCKAILDSDLSIPLEVKEGESGEPKAIGPAERLAMVARDLEQAPF